MEQTVRSKQYLTFSLAEEHYGLNVLQVKEVLEIPRVTRVPRMPVFMKGVINIRGSVIPVIDLRLKLGLEEAEKTINSRVIIIEVESATELISLGVLVDSVQEVLDIKDDDVSPPPQIGTKIEASFINGIAKIEQGFIIVIDINRIFESGEIQLMGSTQGDQASLLAESAVSQ